METLFGLSSQGALPFWALMILLPRWRWTQRIIGSPWIAIIPALVYLALVVPRLGAVMAVVSQPMPSVAAFLGTPEGATIAWAHFLAFDLLIGRWIYLDSQERGISAWFVSPLLYLVLMVGPVGFVLYLILRSVVALVRSRTTPRPISNSPTAQT